MFHNFARKAIILLCCSDVTHYDVLSDWITIFFIAFASSHPLVLVGLASFGEVPVGDVHELELLVAVVGLGLLPLRDINDSGGQTKLMPRPTITKSNEKRCFFSS